MTDAWLPWLNTVRVSTLTKDIFFLGVPHHSGSWHSQEFHINVPTIFDALYIRHTCQRLLDEAIYYLEIQTWTTVSTIYIFILGTKMHSAASEVNDRPGNISGNYTQKHGMHAKRGLQIGTDQGLDFWRWPPSRDTLFPKTTPGYEAGCWPKGSCLS